MGQSHSFADFIRDSRSDIIARFEAFARTFSGVAATMTAEELRDHAAEMLNAIARDLETIQSDDEQIQKAEGHGAAHAMEASGTLHADARIGHGFSLEQLLAEFRALRASVLSLYDAEDGPADLAGIRRFNEAIDEALAASSVRFSERLNIYRDQFIGMLGHDLRSPLGAITAGAALLSMPDIDGQQRPRVSALILRSAQRMDGMIADLLDLTRSRLGTGIPVQLAPADLDAVCSQAILEAQVAHHQAGAIAYDVKGDLRGSWDAARLMQVATNLIHNALEHGDGQAVRVVADGTGHSVQLRISNRGPAISPERLRSIFEPFVRNGPTQRPTDGLGLGLFIVNAIVVAHHGTVAVTSTDADGTTFVVDLPRTPPQSSSD